MEKNWKKIRKHYILERENIFQRAWIPKKIIQREKVKKYNVRYNMNILRLGDKK